MQGCLPYRCPMDIRQPLQDAPNELSILLQVVVTIDQLQESSLLLSWNSRTLFPTPRDFT